MNREKLTTEKYLRIYFTNNDEILVDVNSDIWQEILNRKDSIARIETNEWSWNLQTGEVIFH